MKLVDSFLDVVKVFNLKKFEDERGFFVEQFHSSRYKNFQINDRFVQDNQSRSQKNVLRGLHFTINNNQSQMMTVA
ncbi:MAG: dTDP-4-dehydrorhamnose 3,5-epimerase family protein, partial [Gammaproteobacteria bacterium]